MMTGNSCDVSHLCAFRGPALFGSAGASRDRHRHSARTGAIVATRPISLDGSRNLQSYGDQSGHAIILLFRAQDRKGMSRVGYAASSDGLHFQIRPEPVLSLDAAYERNGGVEDPRVVAVGGAYYLAYTSYDGHSAQLCLVVSKDLIHGSVRA
jgi:beta-1,4-mannooligosaccharide phosphorylase